MPTNAVMTVPADEVALTETVEDLEDCRFRVEKTAFSAVDPTVHLWIAHDNCDRVRSALDDDSSVRDHTLVARAAGEYLFDLEIANRILLPREVIHRCDGTIREAYGRSSDWILEVRFPDRDRLSQAADLLSEYDVDVSFRSITDVASAATPPLDDLTDHQHEALRTAIEMGYYEIPREATLEDIAAELDVSHQALSECLRRAQGNLARDELSTGASAASGQRVE